jgi:predicted metal-dependent hydrolase
MSKANHSSHNSKLITHPKGHPYKVRVSARAKHVSIRVSNLAEVEIVIPSGFDRKRLPEILERRQDWIEKTIRRVKTERQHYANEATESLPTALSLRAIAEEWQISYQPNAESFITTRMPKPLQLSLSGAVSDSEYCRQVLCHWLTQKANAHFGPWLRSISQEVELPFNKISVRGQKTLWASCSSRKSISLNYKLLFLPPELVRYVMIHELCHTVHLNHSDNFWGLVEEKEPDYRRLDKETSKAWRYVPDWVERHTE